ncbi:DUF2603 domain-containing protein [Helicobacter mesocricetorum]|uniref:DUF2603 domain-containing protein n=1 Tax=Helicobacter mesocricetorum TaxID=87012 RepID=UPI000CF02BDB|nr:DUF2603 domain-containing protein [Helicobacter mesocricetorum]
MATSKSLIQHKETNCYQKLKQAIMQTHKHISDLPESLQNFPKDSLAYCLKDSNNEEYYLLSAKIVKALMESAKKLEEDKYLFKLEQEIYKSMPIDFDDVWCIALKEIKNYKKDPKKIIQNIKKRYPYLFINFDMNNTMNNIRI